MNKKLIIKQFVGLEGSNFYDDLKKNMFTFILKIFFRLQTFIFHNLFFYHYI